MDVSVPQLDTSEDTATAAAIAHTATSARSRSAPILRTKHPFEALCEQAYGLRSLRRLHMCQSAKFRVWSVIRGPPDAERNSTVGLFQRTALPSRWPC